MDQGVFHHKKIEVFPSNNGDISIKIGILPRKYVVLNFMILILGRGRI
jgi:hypothetical protein